MGVLNKWDKLLTDVQLTESEAKELKKHADNKRIELFFTPMYLDAVDICESLKVKRYKVRGLDAYWDELLLKIRMTGKPCYVSRNRWLFKQRNFYTVYIDEKRPTKFNEIPFYPHEKGDLYMGFYSGYSCHCTKLMAPIIAMHFVDYIEIHCTLDPNDKSLPDWKYSFGFIDIFELCRWRNIFNSINPYTNRPRIELA